MNSKSCGAFCIIATQAFLACVAFWHFHNSVMSTFPHYLHAITNINDSLSSAEQNKMMVSNIFYSYKRMVLENGANNLLLCSTKIEEEQIKENCWFNSQQNESLVWYIRSESITNICVTSSQSQQTCPVPLRVILHSFINSYDLLIHLTQALGAVRGPWDSQRI